MLGNLENSPAKVFGYVLRRERKALGISQEKLSLEAGIQRNYVSLIELGKNQPTIGIIFKLARVMNLKPSQLIQMVEDELV
jgi:transcriptional regulator with XRE-family HTH domain